MNRERLIPKMFHRRLTLLMAVMVCACVVLGAQTAHLTLAKGADRLATALSRLDRREFLPTTRGAIYDRNGVALAMDRASYDVAVQYGVISGTWVVEEAGRVARDKAGAMWREMSPVAREQALLQESPALEHRVEQLWDMICGLGGISREELELRLDRIRRSVEAMAAETWSRQRAREYQMFGAPEPGRPDTFKPLPIREQKTPHVILPRVPESVAFEFKRQEGSLPGLVVVDAHQRAYPWSTVNVTMDASTLPEPIRREGAVVVEAAGVADHILGGMRDQVWESDIRRRPFAAKNPGDPLPDLGGYRAGEDSVGARGLELVFEDHLRGLRGVIDTHLNTGEVERVDPTPGRDLHLTLDIRVQAKVQAILSPEFGLARVNQWHAGWEHDGTPKPTGLPLGRPLNSAAVVIDVDTGDVLAMVTMPTIAIGEQWPGSRRALEHPFINRAAEAPYPPGSIIKPLVLAAAVTEGVHRLDDRIECTGHYFPNWKDRARCWIYREVYGWTTHSARFGPLDAQTAIGASCNIYFYTLAEKLGAERMADWLTRFGLGATLDLGLMYEAEVRPRDGQPFKAIVGENPGAVPTRAGIEQWKRQGNQVFETIMMGIGQGPITWTPLHAANAFATLARDGYVRDARLLKQDPRPLTLRREGDLSLDPRAVAAALEGLRRSIVEDYGTGNAIRYPDGRSEPIINAPGVTVWAKTGTAQAPPFPVDDDGDGRADRHLMGLDHAWFVGLVGAGESGRARPQYAIAVILEYGGSGGRAAGPIANQIIRALQSEGYL